MLKCIGALAAVALSTSSSASGETVQKLPGKSGEPTLLIRHEQGPGPSVLYVHGASFPSGSSIAYRLDGRSWMDDLHDRGFDVWAFDFAGFGGSDRPAAMLLAGGEPVGRADDAARQIERVALYVQRMTGHRRIDVLAHSWGTVPAGLFAGRRPDLVARLVLFGPVAPRMLPLETVTGSTALFGRAEQWDSFASGIPGRSPHMAAGAFDAWITDYLATDPKSASRTPPSVAVPSGPSADSAAIWAGRFPYDPATVRAPTLIVRGEWDTVTLDADAQWLVKAFTRVPGGALDLKLPQGGHRMHLETNRQSLFDAVGAFLKHDGRVAGR